VAPRISEIEICSNDGTVGPSNPDPLGQPRRSTCSRRRAIRPSSAGRAPDPYTPLDN